jgi:uncharacterized glyoxalase superfamily protein PhnB
VSGPQKRDFASLRIPGGGRSHSYKTWGGLRLYALASNDARGAEVNVIPFLGYENPRVALEWLAKAFGFAADAVHEDENGKVVHAEMRFGDGMVMLGRPGPSFGLKTAKELGAVNQGIYSIVDDGIDAHVERAVAEGAEIVMDLHDPTTAHASTWSGIPRGTSGASAPTGPNSAHEPQRSSLQCLAL